MRVRRAEEHEVSENVPGEAEALKGDELVADIFRTPLRNSDGRQPDDEILILLTSSCGIWRCGLDGVTRLQQSS
jgi:hypothetical protein